MSNHVRRLLGIIVIAVSSLAVSAAHAQIHWRSGVSEGRMLTPQQTAEAIAAYATPGFPRHIVVQFTSPVTDVERDALASAGLSLQAYVSDNAWFATISAKGVDVAELSGVAKLRDAAEIGAKQKLHPSLIAGEVPTWAVVNEKPATVPVVRAEATAADEPRFGAYVVFHKDVDLGTRALATARRYGGTVVSKVESINALVIEIDQGRAMDMAGDDVVQWIEPALPAYVETNDGARTLSGAAAAQAAPHNLTGIGVNVMVYDRGFVWDQHQDLFLGGVFIGFAEGFPVPQTAHATHVGGVIAGSGANSPGGQFAGMAPGATLISYEADFETGFIQGSLYSDPGDLNDDYAEAIGAFTAVLANNSMTTDLAANNFPCAWEGDYGVTAALIDDIARGSLNQGTGLGIIWSAGNERTDGGCGTSYATLPPPAGAKNAITVGAVNTNDGSLTAGTSFGPTDDGRIKPDIVGPGSQVGGDGGITSTSSTNATGYTVMSGSSQATAAVTGLCALLTNAYRAHFADDTLNPAPATLKALLAHTAQDVEEPGPDFKSGFGSARVVPAIDAVNQGRFFESSVIDGGVHLFQINVPPATASLKVTLAWTDSPGSPNAAVTLVNDLDIKATSPGAVVHFPYTLDPANPSVPAVRTGPDRRNNIEQLVVDNPQAGNWQLEVRGFSVPVGPQSFSVVASPNLTNCSSRGVVSLTKFFYSCDGNDRIDVRVIDCDLNTNSGTMQTTSATLSTNHPGIPAATQVVQLTETGPATADFRGFILFTTFTNSTTRLYFEAGDTITATYNDANTGAGPGVSTTTGEIDCTPPVVSNIQFTNILADRFTITFDTDELARAGVFAAEACGVPPEFIEYDDTYQLHHSLTVTGLDDEITYYSVIFDIEDTAGNVNPTEDNGGLCYEVTTLPLPDSFTELFGLDGAGPFDLDNKRILFTIEGGLDFYNVCIEDVTAFNTVPGGTDINPPLVDDNFTQLTVAGETVKLYGQSYSSMFVCSNGRITFTTGDGDFTPLLTEHLAQPAVAAYYGDFSPNIAGTVTWQQLEDRFVVTYENVPEFGTTNSNSFQYELYYNSDIAVTYLNMEITSEGITGLSPGTGLVEDFVPQDFLAEGGCGPRPPHANNQTREVLVNADTTITLDATDDGLPVGILDRIIQAPLPTGQIRDPGNNQVITAGMLPYTLINHGTGVIFHPSAIGNDSIQFRANDTGTPPDGGDSNQAIVTLNVTVGAPDAEDIATEVDEESFVDITLLATDLNNETLRFFILSLPTPGTLTDIGNSHVITPAEAAAGYMLVNNGAVVRYTSPAFQGDVSFTYRARDASNNDSNVATVQVQVGQPDYLTEDFVGGGFDLANMMVTFHADGSVDGYDICVESITQLPSPAAGQIVAEGDDVFTAVNLVPALPFFGMPRSQMFVGSNGYITFNAGDGDFTPTLAEHFGPEPRISPAFNDFNPLSAGDVFFQQLADRAVVTWNNVTEFGLTNQNTFQVEIHNDGDITMSYLAMATTDPIVGLTAGLAAVPADFVETDISATGACGPRPPMASNQTREVLVNADTTITLVATDDGLPAGVLNYIIVAPHPIGQIRDPANNQVINALPYTLLNNGNQVIFRPSVQGTDTIQFRANDTGTPPEGGDSNTATVTLNVTLVPPVAQDIATEVDENSFVDITLMATDPNNEVLRYFILSLPNPGTLTDPGTGLAIGAVPYMLVNNGAVVRYTSPAFQGDVSFTYRARDASNNDSNVATVQIQVGQADYLTELFDAAGAFDLANMMLTFIPDGSVDGYEICVEPITQLPSPAAGAVVAEGDDVFTAVDLVPAFNHFGIARSQMFVGSNGHITFVAGSGDFTESLAEHFGPNPHISVIYDDFNPLAGGDVLFQQLADRAVVTWNAVFEFGTTNPNTFQVELHSDGHITMAYLATTTTDGIVGLSRGIAAVPADFVETDMSATGACGPRPPMAVNQNVQMAPNGMVTITLGATDDGLPDPPAAMTYTITDNINLGTSTLRDAGNNALITNAMIPYTLVNNGNAVIYQASGGGFGADQFQWKANDGGTPPDGGDSNVATVNIEIGSTLIAVTPATNIVTSGPTGGPFPATQVYNVSSQLPSPVTVRVTASDPWISMDGGTTPVEFTLNSQGTAQNVTIGLSSAANMLSAGVYSGTVTFQNMTTGAGSTTRMVTVDVGRVVYDQASNLPLAVPDNIPAGVTSTINVPDPVCVGDLDFDFNMTHTFVGDLVVTLTHNGTTVVLIDRPGTVAVPPGAGCGQDNYANIRLDDEGTGGPIETQCPAAAPAATSPPSFTPNNPLSAWDGQSAQGDWILNVSDNLGIDVGTVTAWALRVSTGGPLCGPQAGNVSADVRTAIQTDITLLGTTPGDPLTYVIDSLPAHGTIRNTNNQLLAVGSQLPNNSNIVRYTSAAGYHGPDSFTYYVTDGAMDSNIATVSLDVGETLIAVTPAQDFAAAGPVGGPFTGTFMYTVTSQRPEPVQVEVARTEPWISLNGGAGPVTQMLNGVGATLVVTVSINSAANSLANGDYIGMVEFTNLTTGAGDTSRNVSLDVGAPSPQLVWNMNTNPQNESDQDHTPGPGLGWQYASGWAYGVPTGGGTGTAACPGHDPTSGFTGTNVIGFNLSGNYTNQLPNAGRNMTMRYSNGAGGFVGLDLTGLTETELHFQRMLGIESSSFDDASVEISTDGVVYTELWHNPVGCMADQDWVPQVFDIASIADNQPNVFIRFKMGPTDDTTNAFGWNLDDIEIWGVSSTTTGGACCVGDTCTEVASASACDALGFVCDVATNVLPECGGPCETECYGDSNGDGTVSPGDRGFIAANIGQTNAAIVCQYDMNGDGTINPGDRGFVAANIGLCTALPDWQNGSGMNHGVPDGRYDQPVFTSGGTCGTVECD